MKTSLHRVWMRLPTLIRAPVLAIVILTVGQLPPGLFLFAGLKLTPEVPWFLLATLVWLWMFWSYLDGRWWPATTAAARRANLRGNRPPSRILLLSLLAGGLGMVSALSGALLTGLVADLPKKAYEAPFDLRAYPPWTVLAFFLAIAIVAGVVEEAAFRGYMLSMIAREHGALLSIMLVAALFYVVHLSHVYATVAFVPFFLAYSVLHGALAVLARSIVPSVVLHAVGDFVILPVQYGVVANPLGSSVRAHVLSVVCFGILSVLAFRRLATAVRGTTLEGAR